MKIVARTVPRPAASRSGRGAGFTLIELMVVLAVIGIMTALMIPEMRGTFEHAVLRGAARKVVDACNLAHSRAVTRHEAHRVRIDAMRGRYAVEVLNRGRFSALPDVPGAEGELDRRVALEVRPAADELAGESETAEPNQDRSTIGFRPDGTAESADILLRDREGFLLNLRVNPATARIEIMEGGRK